MLVARALYSHAKPGFRAGQLICVNKPFRLEKVTIVKLLLSSGRKSSIRDRFRIPERFKLPLIFQ
jgi:hypothetical protein